MPEVLSSRNETFKNGVAHKKKNPFFDSPGSDSLSLDSLPLERTPIGTKVVTFDSAALEPPSPPKIKRKPRIEFPDMPPVEKVNVSSGSPCDSTWASSVSHSHGFSEASSGSKEEKHEKKNSMGSPHASDTSTLATGVSHATPSSKKNKSGKKDMAAWEMSSALKNKIKGMKKIIPKMLQAMNRTAPKKVDLTDLSVATLCLMPRNGAGMEEGRKCFERMRTSLMLHLIQQQGNGAWVKQDASKYEGERAKKQKGQIAKLNNLLHDCIADKELSFAETTQEVSD
jgi:hypothetical protein